MKARKMNDSPDAIFTIDHNHIYLNSALAKCLLRAAFKSTDHVPCFLPDRSWGSLEPSSSWIPKSVQPHACLRGLLKTQIFQIWIMKQTASAPKDVCPVLSDRVFHFDGWGIHTVKIQRWKRGMRTAVSHTVICSATLYLVLMPGAVWGLKIQ